MNTTQQGYLYTFLSAVAFASLSLFTKWAFDWGLSPWSFALLMGLFSVLILTPMQWRERPQAARQNRRRPSLGLLIGLGLFGAAAGLSFTLALVHLSISLTTILLFTYPAFVALGAWVLLGQRPTRWHLATVAVTLVGAVLTVDLPSAFTGAISLVGIGLALLSAVSQGFFIVLGERVGSGLTPTEATIVTRATITLGTVLLHPAVLAEAIHTPWQGVALAALASLVGGVGSFWFLYKGIALIGANPAAIVSVAELPVALLLGMLFQSETIAPMQWAGAALIALAMILSQRQPATA